MDPKRSTRYAHQWKSGADALVITNVMPLESKLQMTTQSHEKLKESDAEWIIFGIDGSSYLFDPHKYGFEYSRYTTAAARGFRSTYKIDSKRLFLDSLEIGCTSRVIPTLNGVEPILKKGSPPVYYNVNLHIPHTGTLLLGLGYQRRTEMFAEASEFETICELEFTEGTLIDRKTINLAKYRNDWWRQVGIPTSHE